MKYFLFFETLQICNRYKGIMSEINKPYEDMSPEEKIAFLEAENKKMLEMLELTPEQIDQLWSVEEDKKRKSQDDE